MSDHSGIMVLMNFKMNTVARSQPETEWAAFNIVYKTKVLGSVMDRLLLCCSSRIEERDFAGLANGHHLMSYLP